MAKVKPVQPAGRPLTDIYSVPNEMGPQPIVTAPPLARQESLGASLSAFSASIGIAAPKLLQESFKKIDEQVQNDYANLTLKEQEAALTKYEGNLAKEGKIPKGTEIYRLKAQKKYLTSTVLEKTIVPQLELWIQTKSGVDGDTVDEFMGRSRQLFNTKFPEGGMMRRLASERWGTIITSARHQFTEIKRNKQIKQSSEDLAAASSNGTLNLFRGPPFYISPPNKEQLQKQDDLKNSGEGINYPTKHPFVRSPIQTGSDETSFSNALLTSVTVYLKKGGDGEEIEVGKEDNGVETHFVIPTMIDGEVMDLPDAMKVARSHGWKQYKDMRFATLKEANEWAEENHGNVLSPLEDDYYDNEIPRYMNKIITDLGNTVDTHFNITGSTGKVEQGKGITNRIQSEIRDADDSDDIEAIQLVIDSLRARKSGFGYLGSKDNNEYHSYIYNTLDSLLEERADELEDKPEETQTEANERITEDVHFAYQELIEHLENINGSRDPDAHLIIPSFSDVAKGQDIPQGSPTAWNLRDVIRNLTDSDGSPRFTNKQLTNYFNTNSGIGAAMADSLNPDTILATPEIEALKGQIIKYAGEGYDASNIKNLLVEWFQKTGGRSAENAQAMVDRFSKFIDSSFGGWTARSKLFNDYYDSTSPVGFRSMSQLKSIIENITGAEDSAEGFPTPNGKSLLNILNQAAVNLFNVGISDTQEELENKLAEGTTYDNDTVDKELKAKLTSVIKTVQGLEKTEQITDDDKTELPFKLWDMDKVAEFLNKDTKLAPPLKDIHLQVFKNDNAERRKLAQQEAIDLGLTFEKLDDTGNITPIKAEQKKSAELVDNVNDFSLRTSGTLQQGEEKWTEADEKFYKPSETFEYSPLGTNIFNKNDLTKIFAKLDKARGKGFWTGYDSDETTEVGKIFHQQMANQLEEGDKEAIALRDRLDRDDIVVFHLTNREQAKPLTDKDTTLFASDNIGEGHGPYNRVYVRIDGLLHPLPTFLGYSLRWSDSYPKNEQEKSQSGHVTGMDDRVIKKLIRQAGKHPPDQAATNMYRFIRQTSNQLNNALISDKITTKTLKSGEATWGNGDPITSDDLNPQNNLLISSNFEDVKNNILAIRNSSSKTLEGVQKELGKGNNNLVDTFLAWQKVAPKSLTSKEFQFFLWDQLAGPFQIGHEDANTLLGYLSDDVAAINMQENASSRSRKRGR